MKERVDRAGAIFLGAIAVLVLIALAADAFVRPAYFLMGNP